MPGIRTYYTAYVYMYIHIPYDRTTGRNINSEQRNAYDVHYDLNVISTICSTLLINKIIIKLSDKYYYISGTRYLFIFYVQL